jgi:hypothetical protein
MATSTTSPTETKPVKEKKPAIPAVTRITDNMKRAALQGKLTPEQLDTLATLATSLKVFVSAA